MNEKDKMWKSQNNILFQNIQAGQKINWNEIKERKKKLKRQRLEKNRNHKIIQTSKRLFEEIRRSKCSKIRRHTHLKELKKLLKGKIMEVIKTHDMSRIIEWMLKLGTPDNYDFIIDEIKDNIVDIAQDKYANHVLKCAIKICKAPTRRIIFKKLIEHTFQLLNSKIASPIVNSIYNLYALSEEKLRMRQSLYGEFFKTFNVNDKATNNLKSACEEHSEFKQELLDGTKVNLDKLLNKSWCVHSDLMYSVINEYLDLCNDTEKIELIEGLRPNYPYMIRTKQGVCTAMSIVWNSNAKAKKQLVKMMQDEVIDISRTSDGCIFVLWLLDSIDDTILVKKVLLKKINENIVDFLNDKGGRKIIVYIFDHRRQNSFFTSSRLKKLEEADKSQFVKKEKATRINELQEACFGNMIDHMVKHTSLWLSNGPVSLVTVTILNHTFNKKHEKELGCAFQAIASYLCHEDVGKENIKTPSIMERSHVHYFVKKIINLDLKRHNVGLPTLSESIVNTLEKNMLKMWIECNRGCYVIERILCTNIPGINEKILSLLKNPLVSKHLKKQHSSGASCLEKKIR